VEGRAPFREADMQRKFSAFCYGALIFIAAAIPPAILILDLLKH
jgi:hypothetical protein